MKTGFGPKPDVKLCEAVRRGVGDDFKFMVDANHCYTTSDAFYVGRALEELDAYWFEEPIAPEDIDGYRELRAGLRVNISGGEAEFNRWGWRNILENRGLDIAQPEVCALGGVSEYLRVLALCHAHFTPVINHVWGSAIAVATNLQLLAAMPPCRVVCTRGSRCWNLTPPTTNFATTCWQNRSISKGKSKPTVVASRSRKGWASALSRTANLSNTTQSTYSDERDL